MITVLLPSHDGVEPCNAVGLNQRIVEHISDMGALHLTPRDGALPIIEVSTVDPIKPHDLAGFIQQAVTRRDDRWREALSAEMPSSYDERVGLIQNVLDTMDNS